MSDLAAVLERIAALGLELRAEGGRLLCHGPRRLITRELQAELAARKHEILAHLASREPAADAPLSYAQQRLWFLDQMQPGQPAYNLSLAQHVRGALDVEALRSALGAVVRRHAVLRSVFPAVDGVPVQRTLPAGEAALPLVDLTQLPRQAREGEALRRAQAEMARPFDLAADPMLRATLYRLEAGAHLLLVTAHHMAADGWSVALIGRELGEHYAAALAGVPARLPAPAQYAAYARWQREALGDAALAPGIEYWKRSLAQAPRVLALPTDRPRPPVASFRGARVEFPIDAGIAGALRRLAERAGATLFMLLAAASAVLLGRHAGSRDVVVGVPIAGRHRPEWSATVGCFVNTLPLRVRLAGDPAFEELLRQVRDTALEAFDHQDVPFERLVEALHPERDLARNPLVQASVGLHNAPGQTPWATFALPGLEVAPAAIDPATVRFDVELDFWELGPALHARLLYARDLFEPATAERMAAQLAHLLAAIAADPGVPVSRLPLLSAEERRALATRWNPPDRPAAPARALHELVREQASRAPGAIAVVCGAEELRYGELMSRAARLAARLRAAGVARDEPVGLCATRSAEAVIGMLGILESGAAYVPLDPEHPPARSALALADSGARFVVTQRALVPRLAEAGVRTLLVEAQDDPAEGEAPAPRDGPDGESLAYVMYTSGSTGRPKGVAVPHRAVVGLLEAIGRVLPLGHGDTLLAVTTFAFDISVLEVFLPLTRGARLALATREETLDARLLAAAIAARGATAMQATPATWSLLVEGGWQGAAGLRALVGGEALDPRLAAALRARCARLWNVYGPTEATIWSSADEVGGEGPITIGLPLANTDLHVLDEAGEPQAIGLAGEIWIGGEGLARGYLRQPALTAAAFRPDPFSARPGARLYRSGDLGRRRADGRIECLGRIDHQVKLRGFRVEPGEVEAALATHASVAKAVVVPAGETSHDRRLVAYVVPAAGARIDAAELRRHAQQRLPAYLVPGAIVALEALPTNASGKVDRGALPAPSPQAPRAPAAASGASATERALAQIWAGVLGIDAPGVEDNFFDLGGHSLLLARVRAQVAERLGREVAILDLFRFPTLRALARHLDGIEAAPRGADDSDTARRQAAAIRRMAEAAGHAKVGDD